jgi:hypothetical protein
MRIPFVGQSYTQRSTNLNAQRTVNWYAELSPDGKSTVALLPRPGQTSFSSCGSGPIRGGREFNGVGYVVSGNAFYTVTSAGVATNRGTLNSGTGRVWLAFNGTQVMVTDGVDGYIYTLATTAFAQITDPDFEGGGPCTFIDGYFIVSVPGTGLWQQSALSNGLAWVALDVATAESSPDNLIAPLADHNELIGFGDKTIEFWANDAGTDFSFTRYIGAELQVGLAGASAFVQTDEGVCFLGDDGVVYRLLGHQIQRISTHAIETALQDYSTLEDCYALTFDWDGHKFALFTFPTAAATWVYDIASQAWVEFSTWLLGHWDVTCAFRLGRKVIVGSGTDGSLRELSAAAFDDDGTLIERVRSTQVAHEDQRYLFWHRLELEMETGVGLLSGQGSSPVVMLSWSDDGGHTWSNEVFGSLGAIGAYGWRVYWDALGESRNRIYKLRITDPVKPVLIAARADVSVGAF